MGIQILRGRNEANKRANITIVIDVIRAFTVAHYAFMKGARRIYLVETVEEAFQLKKNNPSLLLAGEVDGYPIEGFEFDNSPFRMKDHNVSGETIVQRTTNGVRATLNCLNSDHLFVTGFSNARSTAEFIQTNYMVEDLDINIVASHPSGDDDYACAEYIQHIIDENTEKVTEDEVKRRIIESDAARKFFNENNIAFIKEDILHCAKELTTDFVMKVNSASTIPMIERVQVC
ncbi:2-phosphosulfolactate phosphatase [Bacillus sp. JCM 19034]|uniref:2-phosphosulfolactate phosphatase n=1 Tax=Bacillus sp. JCM 19034 TaxID=1481928 RepID=UPI000781E1CD|nr:2-phosphosulfolactate phosphatase [Bacillus sp. JCM 19034]